MNLNEEIYQFISKRTWSLTEEWYDSINKEETDGVYASECPEAVQRLKEQNHAFHERFCKLFILPEQEFLPMFEEWVVTTARDEGHLDTPSHLIAREFFRVQEQHLSLVDAFVSQCKDCSVEKVDEWKSIVIKNIGFVVTWFLKEQHEYERKKTYEQKQTINKLSSPVITLNKDVALLPLIGVFDEERAIFMMEHVLEICSNKSIRRLFVDLSGVVTVNTIVAHQIFQLIDALSLIGVECILSGIRPEIAQTAVQFGDRFSRMAIVSDLEKAIELYLK